MLFWAADVNSYRLPTCVPSQRFPRSFMFLFLSETSVSDLRPPWVLESGSICWQQTLSLLAFAEKGRVFRFLRPDTWAAAASSGCEDAVPRAPASRAFPGKSPFHAATRWLCLWLLLAWSLCLWCLRISRLHAHDVYLGPGWGAVSRTLQACVGPAVCSWDSRWGRDEDGTIHSSQEPPWLSGNRAGGSPESAGLGAAQSPRQCRGKDQAAGALSEREWGGGLRIWKVRRVLWESDKLNIITVNVLCNITFLSDMFLEFKNNTNVENICNVTFCDNHLSIRDNSFCFLLKFAHVCVTRAQWVLCHLFDFRSAFFIQHHGVNVFMFFKSP